MNPFLQDRQRWVLGLVVLLVGLFFVLDLPNVLTLENLKASREGFRESYAANPFWFGMLYFVGYVIVTASSVPGAAVLTLAGGAVFGLVGGTLLVSFASTIGATLAMLAARFLLYPSVEKRFGDSLRRLNRGVEREGAFYLFTLRLVPIVPFFVINLGMGLTKMPARTFYWVSQLGMLPGTIVYVNAGAELGQIESMGDILSGSLLFSFALLGIFPLVAKKGVEAYRKRRAPQPTSTTSSSSAQVNAAPAVHTPRPYDYNLVAIGAGAAGLVTTYMGAALQARVALIEKHKMGGDCLNTGCVPSKALLSSAKAAQQMRNAAKYGLEPVEVQVNFAQVMTQVQQIIQRIEPHDSVERYTALGVECLQGEAFVHSPNEVEVFGQKLTTSRLVIATGARPFVPPIVGLERVPFSHSDNIWELRQLPRRLVVIGGGPIGCELAQAFQRLGSQVTLLERGPDILPKEDRDMATFVQRRMEADGVRILTGVTLENVARVGDVTHVHLQGHDGQVVACEHILVAAGRKANTDGFGLEALGVEKNPDGTLWVDAHLQTSAAGIYACGDVAGPYQFTHMAGHQGWYASVNALFSPLKQFAVDYSVVPWCTYTDPELAHVGLSETMAQAQNIPYEVTVFPLNDLDRAITDRTDEGQIKVLTKPNSDKILGATICGHHAGDLLTEYILAMKHGLGLNKILGTIHPYPTLAEGNKLLAGAWRRNHSPAWLMPYLKAFHTWKRS